MRLILLAFIYLLQGCVATQTDSTRTSDPRSIDTSFVDKEGYFARAIEYYEK